MSVDSRSVGLRQKEILSWHCVGKELQQVTKEESGEYQYSIRGSTQTTWLHSGIQAVSPISLIRPTEICCVP
jgi:hypothetical protein